MGHTASAWFVAFSPDSQYVVSSDQSFQVNVWDWQAGEVVRQFSIKQFSPAGTVVNFSADGQSLFLQTAEDKIMIRQIDLMLDDSKLMEWIHENRYVRELTCDEHELYQIEPLCTSG